MQIHCLTAQCTECNIFFAANGLSKCSSSLWMYWQHLCQQQSYLCLAAHSSSGLVSQECPLKMQGQLSTRYATAARRPHLLIAWTPSFRPKVTKSVAKLIPCWAIGFPCLVTGHHIQLTARPIALWISCGVSQDIQGADTAYDLHDEGHHMLKAGHFYTYRLLVNDALVMQKCWEICVTFTVCDETCMLAGYWRSLSLVIDTSFSNGTFFSAKNVFTALLMSTPPRSCL